PTPDSNTKPEDMASAPIGHATLQPLPPICRFSGMFYVGEGLSATTFTADNYRVYAPGPLGKNLGALHSKVKTLAKQVKDRSDNEFKILRIFNKGDLHMNNFEDDLTKLDMTLR
ncbi:hypothetical protein Tco_0120030, partial [Tanacetum coccineum]